MVINHMIDFVLLSLYTPLTQFIKTEYSINIQYVTKHIFISKKGILYKLKIGDRANINANIFFLFTVILHIITLYCPYYRQSNIQQPFININHLLHIYFLVKFLHRVTLPLVCNLSHFISMFNSKRNLIRQLNSVPRFIQ